MSAESDAWEVSVAFLQPALSRDWGLFCTTFRACSGGSLQLEFVVNWAEEQKSSLMRHRIAIRWQ